MVNYILTYLLVGVGFCLVIDLGNEYYARSNNGDHVALNNIERLLLMVIWPFGLIIFLMILIKNLRK